MSGSDIVSDMRTRQASAELIGTLVYFCKKTITASMLSSKLKPADKALRESRALTSKNALLAKEVERFRQHRLAGKPWRRILRRYTHCPFVVGVAATEHGHEESGINDYALCHRS